MKGIFLIWKAVIWEIPINVKKNHVEWYNNYWKQFMLACKKTKQKKTAVIDNDLSYSDTWDAGLCTGNNEHTGAGPAEDFSG